MPSAVPRDPRSRVLVTVTGEVDQIRSTSSCFMKLFRFDISRLIVVDVPSLAESIDSSYVLGGQIFLVLEVLIFPDAGRIAGMLLDKWKAGAFARHGVRNIAEFAVAGVEIPATVAGCLDGSGIVDGSDGGDIGDGGCRPRAGPGPTWKPD